MLRKTFESEIQQVKDEVLVLGSMVEEAILNTVEALKKRDIKASEEILKAVEGSEVVYLTAGLNYDIKVWRRDWPVIMKNIVEACKKNKSKFVKRHI